MKRAFKILLVALAILVVLLALTIGVGSYRADQKLNRKIDINVPTVAYVSTPESLAKGKYLFESRGCGECHGTKGEGRVLIDDPNGFHVRTPNITSGGATARYTEQDWVRTIRHGVKPDGKPIFLMPSEDYARLTDIDLAAVVAHTRSLPAAAANPTEIRLPLMMKAVYGFGLMLDAAEKIDHNLPPSKPVEVAVSVAHGEYVASMCTGCHGPGLSGGKIPGVPPSWPPAANLTPGKGGVMPTYDTPEKFRAMMRSGKRPNGSEVNPAMPFASLKNMTDIDLDAMYVYLKTVPAREAGGR